MIAFLMVKSRDVGRRNGELIGSKCVPSATPPYFLFEEILKEIEDTKNLIIETSQLVEQLPQEIQRESKKINRLCSEYSSIKQSKKYQKWMRITTINLLNIYKAFILSHLSEQQNFQKAFGKQNNSTKK